MNDLRETGTPLAIVGMAGRFPGASDVDGLWTLLQERGSAIKAIPAERWDTNQQLDPEKTVQAVGGFIDGVEQFDPTFFGISPREAEDIDPQQRLMLEASWTLLEDAGTRPETLSGSRTGVFVGASWHDYEILRKDRGLHPTQHTAVGNALDVIAARISYFYGLKGPSLTVETGCSSAMVALHLACQALASGEIEGAIVGGVNLILAPDVSIGLTRFGGLSPKGRCSAFSAEADGFVRGEGVVALYIKTLERAVADGDRIHAVIAGSAVNNDGGGASLVTPSAAGQDDLLAQVYGRAGVDPDDVVYVEAHGTGTAVGDPVETGAIGRTLASRRDPARGKLAVGSVKTNIGHLEATAGLAGLVKAVLAIRYREIPASLHSETLNPAIEFDALGIEVVREPRKLPEDGPFYVGVNSFGWGGTNAHVILAPPPAPAVTARDDPRHSASPLLVALSAQNDATLRQRAEDIAAILCDGADLAEVAGTLAWQRGHFSRRAGFVASGAQSLAETLQAFATTTDEQPDLPSPESARARGRVAFVFPGQGSQWALMGRELLAASPVFADTIRACGATLAPYVEWDLESVLAGSAGDAWLSQVDMVQPVLWAMSVALAALWRANGVEPDVVVGHSQGEVAAATVAGILTLEDAARVVATRSAIIRRKAPRGLMLAVDLDIESARATLDGFEDAVSLAVNNGPRSCVLSGDTEAIETLKALLDADEVFSRLIRVDYASHSPHMDAFKDELGEALSGLSPRDGALPLFSTVELQTMPGTAMDGAYWVRNLRKPVLFADAMSTLFRDGVTHVIEISPHAALIPALEQLASTDADPARVLWTMKRYAGSMGDLTAAFARAYAAGLEPFGALRRDAHAILPAYPWQRQAYWVGRARPRTGTRGGLDIAMLPAAAERDAWEGTTEISIDENPWLADHKVHEAVVLPGAAMVAILLAAGRDRFGVMPRRILSTRFVADLTLADEGRRVSVLLRDDLNDGGSVSLRSLPTGSNGWVEHATAIVEQHMSPIVTPSFPSDLRGATSVQPDVFYRDCAARGLNYGPAFQAVVELFVGDGSALGAVRLPDASRASARPHSLHPALLDAALQVSLALGTDRETVVPIAVDRITFLVDPEEPVTALWVYVVAQSPLACDITLFAEDERPLAIIEGLTLAPIGIEDATDGGEERVHHLDFVPQPLTAQSTTAPEARRFFVREAEASASIAHALTALGADTTILTENESVTGPATVVFVVPEGRLEAQKQALMHLATLARTLAEQQPLPRLAVVTFAAQAQVAGVAADPGSALAWGFVRVFRREHPELEPVIIDLAAGGDAAISACAEELVTWPGDDQVVLAPDDTEIVRHVGRLQRGEAVASDIVSVAWRSAPQPFRLHAARPGFWDGLEYRPLRREAPGSAEVEVEIDAAALNFIDVMKTMGTYPGLDPRMSRLGGEFAGRIVTVGDRVDGLSPGDRVVGCGFGAFASHATVPAYHVRKIPLTLSFADAAALPLVMTTAWYGLVDLAGLEPGETVLVHSAAGGLGLAAIQVARLSGALVIATAGSEEKRRLLHEMGIDHVFNSRDLSWADGVRKATGGRGVDVVLNSLTGIAITLGLECLAPDGRFIEVGKKDIYGGRSVSLDAFRNRLSMSAVDIAGLMEKRPARFGKLLADVWREVERGALVPLPVTTMPFADAADALRAMGRGSHVGKFVLVDPASVTRVAPEPLPENRLRSDATYVISGGLGALGLSLAEHMATLGAGGLALLGRSTPNEAAAGRIAKLAEDGVAVRSFAVDVSDQNALSKTLDTIRTSMPQLRGVVHAAGLLDDALIDNLEAEQLHRVLAPKIDGAVALDACTQDDPLDFFVLFSSAAALFGNAGQAAYAAGNAALDALAHRRRAEGRPALSVQWGPFAEIGLAAQDELRGARLEERGMGSFTAEEAWLALARFLRNGDTVAGFVPIELRQWFEAYPDTAALPSWQTLREQSRGNVAGAVGQQAFRIALDAAPEEERVALAEAKVRELAGRVLRLDPTGFDRETPFKALGLDSLMGLELRNRLETTFGLKLSPTLLWTYGNAKALSAVLCERVVQAAA